MTDFAALRSQMVERQIAARGIRDPGVLAAMREVPREAFVAEDLRASAYEDGPLQIEADQTISQPYIVALMIEAAAVGSQDVLLEVGAGSGYAAAVMAQVARQVFAIERQEALFRLAVERMAGLGYDNVVLRHGDGTLGWPDMAPFDAILVAACGSHVPEALLAQLAVGGRLVMPVGRSSAEQRLVKVTRSGDRDYAREDLGPVRFVPLIGRHGWSEGG